MPQPSLLASELKTTRYLKTSRLGGVLHDIGKKDISMDIINKAGALTNEEWDLIRSHPEQGQNSKKKQN